MSHKPHYYEIRIEEQLDDHWVAWFSDMEFIPRDQRTCPGTVMSGKLPDQAALFGMLEKIRDLSPTLVSVNCCISPTQEADTNNKKES